MCLWVVGRRAWMIVGVGSVRVAVAVAAAVAANSVSGTRSRTYDVCRSWWTARRGCRIDIACCLAGIPDLCPRRPYLLEI